MKIWKDRADENKLEDQQQSVESLENYARKSLPRSIISEIKLQLPLEFYQQDTVTVAKQIIGKVIEHMTPNGIIATIISEAEAYTQDEPSCHAFKGLTERNKAMFAEPGTIYLYYVYGQNLCINFSTEMSGRGCAVLIRGALPLRGNDLLLGGEGIKNKTKLINGPAKLVKSMRIPMSYYGKSVLDLASPVKIYDEGYRPKDLQTTPRIGISQAKDLPWRFVCKEVE